MKPETGQPASHAAGRQSAAGDPGGELSANDAAHVAWLEQTLRDMPRRLLGRTQLDEPFAQLPMAQFRLVSALPMDSIGETMGRLSEKLRIKASALTQAADRAIRQGLVERLSDPDDRRIVRLRLTAGGRKWTQERQDRRRARIARVWREISPEERIEFLGAVQALERIGLRADAVMAETKQQMQSEETINGSNS